MMRIYFSFFFTLISINIYSNEIIDKNPLDYNFKFINTRLLSLNSDRKDMIGFGFYACSAATLTITGVPLLAVGIYNATQYKKNTETLPFIITGSICLTAGVIMFAGLLFAAVVVISLFGSFKLSHNKYINIVFI